MSNTYEKLLTAAQNLQDEVRALQETAGSNTSKRLMLEQCYSALGSAIRLLVILGVGEPEEDE